MSRAKLQYVGDIIDRLKSYLNVQTDQELAETLGLSRNAISVWRHRENIDLPLIITKCSGLDLHWLITGEGQPRSTGTGTVSRTEIELLDQLRSYGWDTVEFLTIMVELHAVMAKLGLQLDYKDLIPNIVAGALKTKDSPVPSDK